MTANAKPRVPPRAQRNAMGAYVPQPGDKRPYLSSLAEPSPGPQDYVPKLPPSSHGFSILGKNNASDKQQLTAATLAAAAAAVAGDEAGDELAAKALLSKQRTIKTHTDAPGPASYTIPQFKSKEYSFGVKCAMSGGTVVDVDIPGPTYLSLYDTVALNDAPKCKLSGRHDTAIEDVPGPGTYNPKIDVYESRRGGVRIAGRLIDLDDMSPGPGDYSVELGKAMGQCSGPAYSLRTRPTETLAVSRDAESLPAANAYALTEESWSGRDWGHAGVKGASLKGWYAEQKTLKTPGPATYVISRFSRSGPSMSMTRKNLPEPPGSDIPGPGAYDLPLSSRDSKQVVARRMSTKIREASDRLPLWTPKYGGANPATGTTPGPGAYNLSTVGTIRGNKGPKVSMKGRIGAKVSTTPGPSSYTVPVKWTNSTATIPSELANQQKSMKPGPRRTSLCEPKESTPGPGDYDVRNNGSTAPKFSCGQKLDCNDATRAKNYTPGPSSYNAKSEFANKGAGASFKGRPSPYLLNACV